MLKILLIKILHFHFLYLLKLTKTFYEKNYTSNFFEPFCF